MFIEGDASSASYFLAGAAITGGTVTVYGCGKDSIQGDARFAEVLEKMGNLPTFICTHTYMYIYLYMSVPFNEHFCYLLDRSGCDLYRQFYHCNKRSFKTA